MMQVGEHGRHLATEPALREGVLAVVAVALLGVGLAFVGRLVIRGVGVHIPYLAIVTHISSLERRPQVVVCLLSMGQDDAAHRRL